MIFHGDGDAIEALLPVALADGRHHVPTSLAEQMQRVGVEGGQAVVMTDADQCAFGQVRADQGVEGVFEACVDCGGRLVEEDQAGTVDQEAGDPEALLLSGGQDAGPIDLVVDLVFQVTQLDCSQRFAHLLIAHSVRELGIGQRGAQAAQGQVRVLG